LQWTGAYFNVDPVIIRLIFVALFFGGGSSLFIYVILWIVVPKATNTANARDER